MDIWTKIAEVLYAFKPGFSSVYSIWGTIVSVLFIYKTIYTIVGAFCTRRFEPAKKYHKYGIVIAARNEQAVIGNLLDSIKKQDYPAEYLTVFVVADNCTDGDRTAEIARERGAVVYERFDDNPEHKTKGYALKFLFENIERDYGTQSFEGYFVFDADNLLKSDFVSRMNDAFDSGEKIITSYRNSKNFDENWIASTYALHWLRSSRQAHRARSVFRLATNIQGTGFLFASEIVKDGWKYTSLTEDRALTADAVVQGYKITYNDAAEFYDEQPTKLKIALRQRIRWAKGHIMAFKESGWKLFKNIFTYKGEGFWDTVRQRFASYDVFILVLPRPLFTLAKKIIKAFVYIVSYTLSPHFWLWTLVYFYGILRYKVKSWLKNMFIAVYLFIFERHRIKKMPFYKMALYSFTWPIFDIIGKYSMYIALFKKVTWKPIPHESKVTIDDISKNHAKSRPQPAMLKRADGNAVLRILCHAAFAALSFAYSFFMLNVNTNIFYVFVAGNLLLVGVHALCELNAKLPKVIPNMLMFLTFVWNITFCCEVMGNGAISYVFSVKLLLNMALYASPYILLYAITGSVKASAIPTAIIWFAASSANMFLTELRGRPLFMSDLFSIGTALNVANQYTVDITAFYILTLLYITVMIVYFGILEKAHEKGYFKFKWYTRLSINIPVLIIICLAMSSSTFLKAAGVSPYFWSHKVNGFPLNFVVDLQYSNMDKPDGYSADIVEDMYEQYSNEPVTLNAESHSSRPNVIVIMDESFADLRVIGEFDTNIDVMPFIDSLYEDESVISGYSYVSVFGGGTADSEYEFLTGDNMFMYAQGAVPYQTNFKGVTEIPSIVETFNSLNYHTVATHPYLSSGWNRPNIYNAMGFDVQQFIEDYDSPEYYRAYVTDKSDFDNLISLYENKPEGTPLFVFNVTMQNHGGYNTQYRNFEQKIELVNTKNDYPLAEQYLSLLHETDNAVEHLIEYFEAADEPTVIVFFGDHQVQVEDGFYEELYGKSLDKLSEQELLKKYITSYFIWANYDLKTLDNYDEMTALEGRIAMKLAESLGEPIGDAQPSDIASSDIAVSDTANSDAADSDYTKTEKDSDSADTDDTKKSDSADSDTVGSDITGSDVTGSDGASLPVFVTQKKIETPQVVTNLSYLSVLMCKAANIPQSAYQRFLADLMKEYPVITAFGAYDKNGNFYSMNEIEDMNDLGLLKYRYAIYNHVFDRENLVDSFFCITEDAVEFKDAVYTDYGSGYGDRYKNGFDYKTGTYLK